MMRGARGAEEDGKKGDCSLSLLLHSTIVKMASSGEIEASSSEWGEGCQMEDFIDRFRQLRSSLPKQELVKVKINLGCFRDNYARKTENRKRSKFHTLFKLISEHKSSLKEVSFNSVITENFQLSL